MTNFAKVKVKSIFQKQSINKRQYDAQNILPLKHTNTYFKTTTSTPHPKETL